MDNLDQGQDKKYLDLDGEVKLLYYWEWIPLLTYFPPRLRPHVAIEKIRIKIDVARVEHILNRSNLFFSEHWIIILKFKNTLVQIKILSWFANKMLLINFVHFIFKHLMMKYFFALSPFFLSMESFGSSILLTDLLNACLLGLSKMAYLIRKLLTLEWLTWMCDPLYHGLITNA